MASPFVMGVHNIVALEITWNIFQFIETQSIVCSKKYKLITQVSEFFPLVDEFGSHVICWIIGGITFSLPPMKFDICSLNFVVFACSAQCCLHI